MRGGVGAVAIDRAPPALRPPSHARFSRHSSACFLPQSAGVVLAASALAVTAHAAVHFYFATLRFAHMLLDAGERARVRAVSEAESTLRRVSQPLLTPIPQPL